ncbi:ATP-binding protein [Ekhidna sp.]|uniref:ATP-binding protein n=1 Tax=Ekhidna sp. TaxID=2608089 RepID=UPI003296DB7D
MILREIEKELRRLSKEYPVVTILGPRQAGKTTLAKHVFDQHQYVNLELPDHRLLAMNDPNAFFDRFKRPLIIDEIQRVPDLLSYIQVMVDETNKVGDFILTGSNQFQLSESVSQSLAGRTAILKLLPLSVNELTRNGQQLTRDEYLSKGFLPRIYDQNQLPFKAYGNYLETYIERDLRQQINIRNLTSFRIFLKLLAGRVGQVLNLSSLSNDVGVSSTTLSEWLSVLEASYIIYRLPPYYNNFGKRLIKSPKIYFTEIGLASYLLDIKNPSEANRDPLLGGLFENLVIIDLLKKRYNRGLSPSLYFFRDNHGNEVDLLIEEKRKLIPIEIKAAMTFHDRFANALNKFRVLSKSVEKGCIVYAGELEFESENYSVINFQNTDIL